MTTISSSAEPSPPSVPAAGLTGPADLTVAVIGLGYVGISTALGLAAAGAAVIGIDIDPHRIAAIRRGDIDMLQADRERLRSALHRQNFVVTTDPSRIADTDSVIVCVPTPVDRSHTPDLRALSGACGTVVAHARAGQTIVLTSTTYVGSTRDLLAEPLIRRGLRPGVDVHIAFAPERIDPGNSAFPQQVIPRVVGGYTPGCTVAAAKILSRLAPEVHEVSSAEAAEMSKLLENTFRAVNIALANEFADASRCLGVDVAEVIRAASTKPYGFMPFFPGPGVGGHCIPCDPHYLLWQLRAHRVAVPVIDTAMAAIAARPRQVVTRAREMLGDHGKPLAGARVLVVGVTYKPGVADVRASPAVEIMSMLVAGGATVSYLDPLIDSLAGFTSCADPAGDWDLVVVHTVQPGTDLSWIEAQSAVLDATYRLSALDAVERI
jgi:UDP-N-acetyl-D-glucosamine dehydrogenase